MARALTILGILGLLILLAVGSCASTGAGGPPAQEPKNQACAACNGASDCRSDEHCLGGCCRTLDDENPLE